MNGVRTYYLYGDEGLIAEFDETGEQLKSYGYLPGSGFSTNPLYMEMGGDFYFYLNDHLGTPQKLIDTDGVVVWSAQYDSFGNTHIDIEDVVNNLRFAGQYYDAETGLHYNWNRYYNSEMGTYLRTDPLGLDGGVNLYGYALGNPLMFTDAEGLMFDQARASKFGQFTEEYGTKILDYGMTAFNAFNSAVDLISAVIPDDRMNFNYPDVKYMSVGGSGFFGSGPAGDLGIYLNSESGEASIIGQTGTDHGLVAPGANIALGYIYNAPKNRSIFTGYTSVLNGDVSVPAVSPDIGFAVFHSADSLFIENVIDGKTQNELIPELIPGPYGFAATVGYDLNVSPVSLYGSSFKPHEIITIPYLGYILDLKGTVLNKLD